MKHSFCIVISLLGIYCLQVNNFYATAQVSVQWDKTYGGDSSDEPIDAIATSDGGFLVAGISLSNSSSDKSEDSKGNYDYWIIKIDSLGNKLWDKTFGSNVEDYLSDITTTADGGYILAGYSSSNASGDKSENSKGETDIWIIKIDSVGNKLWDKTIGGNSNDGVNRITPTADGGYLLVGNSYSTASGDKTEINRGFTDYWLVKIDANGNKLWDKTFGGSNFDVATDVILSIDGGYLITGWSTSNTSGDKSEDSKGDSDYWLVKTDSLGNKIWDKTLGGSWSDYLINAISTIDGAYLLAGESISDASGDKSEDSYSVGGPDYWIVKVDSNGNKIWDKTLGGLVNDIPRTGIIATKDGAYMLAGYSDSNVSGDKSEDSKGSADFWIVKVDTNGNKLWDKTLGGTDFDSPYSLLLAPNGNYLLTGWSNSPASGDKSENSKGDRDYWIVSIHEDAFYTKSLILVNANTDQDIGLLSDESIVKLSEIGNPRLSVRATTVPTTVDSIKLEIQGPVSHTQLENFKPYTLFGDALKAGSNKRDYTGKQWPIGSYSMHATPYLNGKTGATYKISFSIVYNLAIKSFTLVNADTDTDIATLKDGDIIDLTTLGNPTLSIRANTTPPNLGAVEFDLVGPFEHLLVEKHKPYALFGDNPIANSTTKDYVGEHFEPGNYLLSVYPLLRNKIGTPSFIHFSIVGDTSKETSTVEVFPVPSKDIVNIRYKATLKDAEMILLDFTGQVLLSQKVSEHAVEQLDLSHYKKGFYYLKIVYPDAIEIKRLIIE